MGIGKHAKIVATENLYESLKIVFAAYVLHDITITTPKVSVLLFYFRIFGAQASKTLKGLLWATGALVVAQSVLVIPRTNMRGGVS